MYYRNAFVGSLRKCKCHVIYLTFPSGEFENTSTTSPVESPVHFSVIRTNETVLTFRHRASSM